jgi:hypothetical protein
VVRLYKITLTTSATANTVTTVSGTVPDGFVQRFHFYASGGTRAVTFSATTYRASTGLTLGPFSIPSGQVLIAAVEYSQTLNMFILTAATVSSS